MHDAISPTNYIPQYWDGLGPNVSIQSILEINPEITNPNTIFAGQVIRIPAN
ncbi:LysM peptidoglycan-binding domain-containing protein [Desulfosporosinus sp. Sb-LF]|uniref:LysM peptidoglycan-binding domain-containing protein n=1 Tax=Desulfosporosinus sp. Sb-LF TaxID=2560027 RepID=UPI00249F6D54|nr:LysM peptidoglycan-binding domain-containing protein [Desulfosporosinus sp. Sb-LF]